MTRTIAATAAALMLMTAGALADPIEGNWKTASGETAGIGKCGGSFCITLKTGKYKGKQIGKVALKGKSYVGTVTDPDDDKTYSGSATVNGGSMKLKGCALKIFCKTQNWSKL
ncbi:MAG TPA: DUF2147 domain-containing protein [Rhizobiaceae bacterium]|nr:DUF2147 domain-containing protein [Rhizobiaceae bacterium]